VLTPCYVSPFAWGFCIVSWISTLRFVTL